MTEPRPPSSPRRRVALRWLLLGGALLLSGAALVVLAWTAPDAPPPATLPAPAASAAPTRCQDDPQAVRVELSPVGAVCFAQAPLRAVTLDATYNDILTALDQEERLIATGFEGNHFEGFYAQLPDLSVGVDFARLPAIGAGLDKETLYGLRADVHHIDPERLVLGGRWTRQDVAEIAQNVAPFFANRYSRERSYPGDQPYAYYTTWELHAKLARVYRRAETADALEAIWQQLLRDITARLPPEAERPRVGLIIPNRGRFTPFSLGREGYGTAHYRAVGARDAFASIQALTYADAGRSASLDLEGLAALDPDVIISRSRYIHRIMIDIKGL